MSAAQLPVPQTYAALRRAVETVVLKGRRAIDDAWLRTYHDTGRLIHEFALRRKDRATYGADIFNHLAADTGIDRRTLQQSVQFYRCFPNWRDRANLVWSHYRTLVQVEDATARENLLRETIRLGWTSEQLVSRVRALNAAEREAEIAPSATASTAPALLTPRRGTPGICKILAVDDGLAADLGFACHLDLPPDTDLAAGTFARLDTADRLRSAPDATQSDLFTYSATVLKLVDGDTLWVKIHVGQRHWLKQKLRLRDLDCPEIATPEGKAAKRYVADLLARTQSVTLCTTKPDKYDRYLADVFLTLADDTEVYLNNTLLTAGHATVKRAWEFSDWDET